MDVLATKLLEVLIMVNKRSLKKTQKRFEKLSENHNHSSGSKGMTLKSCNSSTVYPYFHQTTIICDAFYNIENEQPGVSVSCYIKKIKVRLYLLSRIGVWFV